MIVATAGHVDHGKTSFLDQVRNTLVVSGESGVITQHIGSYTVEFNDHKITFLYTPVHAAFPAMRSLVAYLTDISFLVISADAVVMPHTI